MLHLKLLRSLFLILAISLTSFAVAEDDPRHERHELMEGVGKAAKPVGKMFNGEREYDAAIVSASLQTWHEASMKFGDLFPAGSETGMDTEAAPAIWEDRAGFDEALADFREAVETAKAADLNTLDAAKPAVGPVFQTCKGCHDSYRIED
ncbi:MAG: c-type cytochrome [Woeseiaceae bacterium]